MSGAESITWAWGWALNARMFLSDFVPPIFFSWSSWAFCDCGSGQRKPRVRNRDRFEETRSFPVLTEAEGSGQESSREQHLGGSGAAVLGGALVPV